MKAHMWGSTMVADGKLYAGDEDGDFVVLAAAKDKKVLSETESWRAGLFHAGCGKRNHLRRQQHASLRARQFRQTDQLRRSAQSERGFEKTIV